MWYCCQSISTPFYFFFPLLVSLKHFALKFQLLVLLLRYDFRLNKLQNPPWYVAKYIFHCHIIISFRHCIHRLINETNLKFFLNSLNRDRINFGLSRVLNNTLSLANMTLNPSWICGLIFLLSRSIYNFFLTLIFTF